MQETTKVTVKCGAVVKAKFLDNHTKHCLVCRKAD